MVFVFGVNLSRVTVVHPMVRHDGDITERARERSCR